MKPAINPVSIDDLELVIVSRFARITAEAYELLVLIRYEKGSNRFFE